MTRFLSAVASVCLAAAVLAAPDDKKSADAERLVQQLGAARHADREKAARALDALGPAALPALRDGARSGDAEISRRAGELLAKLDRQSESAAALAPTKVHIKATDALLADIVRDLTKQSKMKFLLAREPVDLSGRRVTLDTGSVGIWEALAAVCRAARVSVRPGTLDPDGTDAAAITTAVVPAAVPNAAGGIAVMTVASRLPADEPLVLQDGGLPEYPTAILGAVRVRLIPDRWANRDRAANEEVRWTLEVLTEPRVQWVGRPSFRFNGVSGFRAAATPTGGDAAVHVPVRVSTSSYRVTGDAHRGPSRHELPVYVTADAKIGTVAELTGSLAGTLQAPAGELVTVADVTAEKAAAARDGTRMKVTEFERADEGTVTLKVEVERAGGTGGSARTVTSRAVRRVGPNGAISASVARALFGAYGAGEAFGLTDATGRAYEVTVTRAEVGPRDGVQAASFTLECAAAGAGGPKALTLTGPRQVTVEAAFTLRDVRGR